jgi:hypothetical protein
VWKYQRISREYTVSTHQLPRISQSHILTVSYSHPYAKHSLGQVSDMLGAAAEDQVFGGEEHQGVLHDKLRRADR